MKLTLNRRWKWWLIGLAFAGTLAAKNYVDGMRKTSATVTDRDSNQSISARAPKDQQSPSHLALEQLHRKVFLADTAELFRRKSWYIPPPPIPKPPPPAPVAPPLPFTFLGKVKKPDGRMTIFLSDKDRVYLVHGGETLANNYHFDGIKHGRMVFTYLPLKKKQYLNIMESH